MTPDRTVFRFRFVEVVLLMLAAGLLGASYYAYHSNALAALLKAPPPPREMEELKTLPGLPDQVMPEAVTSPIPEDVARSRNAEIPFLAGALEPARPFRFTGSAEDHRRALRCLALAALAEAGSSDEGQKAVMQVVLNRVRHPAFAKTICGVVFQGAERATGCQFSFTCDGALARQYAAGTWASARKRADSALFGYVYRKIGVATHYHTDWVLPWWSPQLDKIARVETHLFFKWRGYWGTRSAMRAAYRGGEPDPELLIAGSNRPVATPDASQGAADAGAADGVPVGGTLAGGSGAGEVMVKHPDGGAFLVLLHGNASPSAALAYGRRLCGGNGYCRVMGWTERNAIPRGFPIPPASRAQLQFSYVLDDTNAEVVHYNCKRFRGVSADQCIASPPN